MVVLAPGLLDSMLRHFAGQMLRAYHDGITMNDGSKYYLAFLGQKGDMEFQAKSSHAVRNYLHLGVDKGMCFTCLAGHDGFPFEDCTDLAAWIATMHSRSPFDPANPEPLGPIPFGDKPELKYLPDLFHFLKHGIYRDAGGSAIVLLGRLGYFDANVPGESRAQEAILDRTWQHFKFWVSTEGKCVHLRSFSRQMLHLGTNTAFPWGGWKGSDSMRILQWLIFFCGLCLGNPKQPDHVPVLRAVARTLE